jgi:hypothetical protein
MTDISFPSTVPAERISFVEEGNLIVKEIKKGPLQNTVSSSPQKHALYLYSEKSEIQTS